MTTTNDGGPDFSPAVGGMAGIHPMVMKAAKALFHRMTGKLRR